MENQRINDFINIAIQSGGWMVLDRVYLKNRLLSLIGEWSEPENTSLEGLPSSTDLLKEMLIVAENNNKVDATDQVAIEKLSAEIMELLTPPPSVVNALFSQHYDHAEKEATDYFHLLAINNGYIDGTSLVSKEVDILETPWQVKQKSDVRHKEMICEYCFDSEGYGEMYQRIKRIIRMNLKGESWGFSYAELPLVEEHCEFFPEAHESITFSRQTMERMLRLLDIYPHYFVGYDAVKNAGKEHGSLMGGAVSVPLFQAEEDYVFDIPGFVTVSASLVEWPISVIRLKTTSKKNLINSIEYLMLRWQQYSYPSLDIMANDESGQNQHSLIPIFRKEGEMLIADLLLVDKGESFERSQAYRDLLLDENSIADRLGIVPITNDIELTDETELLIKESIEEQGVFKKSPEGIKAFIRFVDTL